jgi:hypothetical protein
MSFFAPNLEAQRLLADALRQSPTGNAYLAFAVPFCQKLRVTFQGEHHRVQEIGVRIHAVAGVAPMALRQYELTRAGGEAKLVSHLEATVAGKKITILIPEGAQSKRICVRIGNAKLDSAASSSAVPNGAEPRPDQEAVNRGEPKNEEG